MPTICAHLDVDRDVAEVWDVWSDVRRLPELSPSTDAVEDAPARLTEVGQSFRQLAHVPGRALDVTWTVTAVADRDHLVIEATPLRGVHLTITEHVERIGAGRTRLTLTIEYRLPFGPLGRVVNRLGLERRAATEAAQVVAGVVRLVTAPAAR